MRYAWAWIVWAAQSVGYWIRPYDMIADARRWRWQRRTPCGRQVFAAMPADVQAELIAAAERLHRDTQTSDGGES